MTATCYSTTATPFRGEVALSYWQTLTRVAEREGVSPSTISRVLNNTEKPSIVVSQYVDVMRFGLAICNDFGLKVGCAVTPGSYPVLGVTLLSCQTIRQVLSGRLFAR